MLSKLGIKSLINVGIEPTLGPFGTIQKKTFNTILLMAFCAIVLSLSTNILESSWTLFDTIFYSSMCLIMALSYILLRLGRFRLSVLLFIGFMMSIMFLLALMTQEVFLSSICTLVIVMVAIIVLSSVRLQILLAVLLFTQQIAIFWIVGHDYQFWNEQFYAVDSNFSPLTRSIVYACFFWFLFAMTFSLKWQITRTALALKLKTDEIQTSYLEMEKFGHVISHDLKSPIRNMTNFAGLISKKIKNEQFEKVDEYANIIQASGVKAIHLIDDVLTFSKLKSVDQKEVRVSIDLEALLIEVENDLVPLYPNSSLRFNQIGTITGNYAKIKTLFQNLIENGLKYNESEAPIIKISRHINSREDIIIVEDNGIGIDEHHYETIFEPFKRLHNDTAYSGSGIGLASCKSIVNEHLNGQLEVNSQLGIGSSFTIRLANE